MDSEFIEEIKNGEIYRLSKRFKNIPSFKYVMYDYFYSWSRQHQQYKTPLEYACEALCLESVVFFVERGHAVNFSYDNRSMSLLGIILCRARNYSHTTVEDMKKAYMIIRYLRKNGYQIELPAPKISGGFSCENGCFYFDAINISFEHRSAKHAGDDDISDKNLIIANILIQLIKMGLDPCAKCCHRGSFIDQHRAEMNYQMRNYYGYSSYSGNHGVRFLIEYSTWNIDWKHQSKDWTLFQIMLPTIIPKDEKYRFFKYQIVGFRNSMRSIRSISSNKKQRFH